MKNSNNRKLIESYINVRVLHFYRCYRRQSTNDQLLCLPFLQRWPNKLFVFKSYKNCYECPFAINFNCIYRRQEVLRWRRSRQQKQKTKKTKKKLKGFVETKMHEWNFLSSLNSKCKFTVVWFVVQRKKRGIIWVNGPPASSASFFVVMTQPSN